MNSTPRSLHHIHKHLVCFVPHQLFQCSITGVAGASAVFNGAAPAPRLLRGPAMVFWIDASLGELDITFNALQPGGF